MEEDVNELRGKAKENLRKAKEKDMGKVAVRVGDKSNTILIVPRRKAKTAAKDFLEKTKNKY